MRIDVSGQQDIELDYDITLVVDFTAYGHADANYDGDPAAGFVHKFTDIECNRIVIDAVTIKGLPKDSIKLTQDSINQLTEAVREYAEQLIEDSYNEQA